jgi:multiple sugar transport system substrate-binding protein
LYRKEERSLMKRKLVFILLIMAAVLGMLTGCRKASIDRGDKENDVRGDTSGKDVAAAKKTDIVIWYYWENESHQRLLSGILKDFNNSQQNITVTAKYIPYADFRKLLSIGATAAKLPDIVILDNPDTAAYAAMGIFADLTGKIDTTQYYEAPLKSCTLDERLYGIPFGSNCLALFYNEDMLKAAGCKVPETWDELAKAAKKTTTKAVSGFAFSSMPDEEGTFNFLSFMWSAGTDSYSINNKAGIKALNFVGNLVRDGSMTKEAINWTQGDTMNQFITGNLAMMINGTWQVPTIREQVPGLKWNVAALPKDKENVSGLGGENISIIKNSKSDASLEFVKYVTAPERVKSYMDKFGYIASRKDVAETQYKDDSVMQFFIKEMRYAKARGPHPEWPSISDAISLAFNEVITQASTPEAAAAKAQKTINEIVKK